MIKIVEYDNIQVIQFCFILKMYDKWLFDFNVIYKEYIMVSVSFTKKYENGLFIKIND